MPIISITNQVASQSLRGQNCKITVDLATQSAEFAQLKVGQLAQNSGGNECYIYSIDNYGNSFEVAPLQPDKYVGVLGYVQATLDIDVTV